MQNTQHKTNEQLDRHISILIRDRNFIVSTRGVLISIMIVAVALRLFSAFYQGNNVAALPGVYDQISYDGLARRVAGGFGFSFAEGHWPATRAGEPTAHWSYLYTLYLAAVYKIFGTYPLVARIIQALVAGVIQTFLVWRIGKHIFNRTVGLIAAGLNAIYIYFFYYAGALITETFYITCILWTFDAAFRIVQKSREAVDGGRAVRFHQWLELGAAAGFTVLLRQVFLLFLPFLFFWIWWNGKEDQAIKPGWASAIKNRFHWPALKGILLSTIVLALMILPFTIRNYRAFGTFVLLNTNAGFAFYWGNHPIHKTHFMPLLTGSSYQDLIPPQYLSLNEGRLDKVLLREGLNFVFDDPIRYMLLSLSRVEEYIKFWPSQNSSLISNISRIGSFGILLPFMLYGLFKSIGFRRDTGLTIIYLFIVVYTFIHLLTWTLIRYRLPIDAFLVLFAAVGIDNLIGNRYLRTKTTNSEI